MVWSVCVEAACGYMKPAVSGLENTWEEWMFWNSSVCGVCIRVCVSDSMNDILSWVDLTGVSSSKDWYVNTLEWTENVWGSSAGKSADDSEVTDVSVPVCWLSTKVTSLPEAVWKPVPGLLWRLGCKDLKEVSISERNSDDFSWNSALNVSSVMSDNVGVWSVPVKSPNSEDKAGVDITDEASNVDVGSDDSSWNCPDVTSWSTEAFGWDIAAWFSPDEYGDGCWIVAMFWVTDPCSVIKYENNDMSAESWVVCIVFDDVGNCVHFNTELCDWMS